MFGFTRGCGGREAKIDGGPKEQHSVACRLRFKEEIMKNDDVKEVIERRYRRRRDHEPPQDAELMRDDPAPQ